MKSYLLRWRYLWLYVILVLGLGLPLTSPAQPALSQPDEAVVPGVVRADAGFEHIGVLWSIDGDSDLDSSLSINYRRQGDASWRPGAPAMRAHPDLIVQGAPLGLNYWAASAMFLEPGTGYEIQLNLNDPDGGSATHTITTVTRTRLQPDSTGRHLYVIPGTGGGDGSSGNPFQGLAAAAVAAQAGDTFHLAAGTYAPFQLLSSGMAGHPITFSGPQSGEAVIDGGGTNRGVVTIGEYDRTTSFVILAGLTIQNGAWGIDAQHTQDIDIQYNTIQNVDFGVYNRRGDGLERNQTVCDNTILGRTPWPQTDGTIPGERGIDLRGWGNVVCHNRVRLFGDCISVQPNTGPSYGNDVFGNDVAYCVDDGIEIDYNQANARVWRNRVTNARMGVSVQPIQGGPAYILRNEFFNLESVPVKMHNDTTGFFVVHNTGVKLGDGYGDNGALWRNVQLRNNLFLGTRYAFEFTTIAADGFRDFDTNAWGTSRAIGSSTDPWFKWDNVRYDRLTDLPPGVEDHGLEAAFNDLQNAALPSDWWLPVEPGSRDLSLVNGVPEIDAGTNLRNLNVPFVSDGQPDAGAFELGEVLPTYGPRPQTPDLSPSSKTASQPLAQLGDNITFTISLRNAGASLATTVTITDSLPAGLAYLPGSLQASAGSVDETQAPELHWQGDLPDAGQLMTIMYAAKVTAATTQAIQNTAQIEAGPAGSIQVQATVIVNGFGIYLPQVIH